MPSTSFSGRVILLTVAVSAAGGSSATERRPAGVAATPPPMRRSFDFAPPRPGETLPNPASPTGSPPRLSEFAPIAPASPGGTPVEDATRRANAPADHGAAVGSPATEPPPAATDDLSPSLVSLGTTLSRLGIVGFLAPDGGDRAMSSGVDASTVGRARRELAASMERWEGPSPPLPRISDAPVDVGVSRGIVTFRNAPDRMVGGRASQP